MDQLRREIYAQWQASSDNWPECRTGLKLLALAEQVIDNMAEAPNPNESTEQP